MMGDARLSRRSVDFFQRAAKQRWVPYQRMIRALVDTYAEAQAGKGGGERGGGAIRCAVARHGLNNSVIHHTDAYAELSFRPALLHQQTSI
jgi:hypothetical protein